MNIQIFGRSKCFDTKKAERYFKERRIRVQQIDLLRYGMSGGEFDSVLRAVGGVDKLIDWSRRDPDIDLLRYMDDVRAKEDKLFERPELMRTPVVRNGRYSHPHRSNKYRCHQNYTFRRKYNRLSFPSSRLSDQYATFLPLCRFQSGACQFHRMTHSVLQKDRQSNHRFERNYVM